MDADRRHSNIQVAITQVDRERQAADETIHDLQSRLLANRSKISQLIAELDATKKQVDMCARTLPQAERQRIRADLRLRQLKEHAEKVAMELAAERLVQDYLEELQRDDEEGERRLKDYVSEVLRRDAEGYGDSDSDSDWSVLGNSVDSLKRTRTSQRSSSPEVSRKTPMSPQSANSPASKGGVTPPTPRSPTQEIMPQDQILSQVQTMGSAEASSSATPHLAGPSPESLPPSHAIPTQAQPSIPNSQEEDIPIMLSESGGRPVDVVGSGGVVMTEAEVNQPERREEHQEESQSGSGDSGDEHSDAVTAKDDGTPQSSRASSPQRSIISAYSRNSPTLDRPLQTTASSDQSVTSSQVSERSTASNLPDHIYPPTSLVLAPKPYKPVTLLAIEAPPTFPAPNPAPMRQLLTFNETVTSPPPVASRRSTRPPPPPHSPNSDSDSPSVIPVMTPNTKLRPDVNYPRDSVAIAYPAKRVAAPVSVTIPPQSSRPSQPSSPNDRLNAHLTARDFRERLERDREPARIDYARQVEVMQAQATQAQLATLADVERRHMRSLREKVAASSSRYALQRPNVSVAGPRPRDLAVSVSPPIERRASSRPTPTQYN